MQVTGRPGRWLFSVECIIHDREVFFRVSPIADPILPNQDPRAKDPDYQQLSYATNMIASLRLERDIERASHNRTRHEADCRIAALEAQVASREAELQGYLAVVDTGNTSQRLNRERPFHTSHSQPTSRRHSSVAQHQHRDLPDVSTAQEETPWTSNKAHALETEVKGLFERVCFLVI
jgi:hypothetical protein